MTHLKYLVWNTIRWILHIKSFLVLTPVFACISTNSRTALDTDESRIGLVTFNVSQEWFTAQAMSFLSVLAYFIINNGPFKYCLTGMGSTALQWHAGGSSLGQGMNEKSCCCWRGGLTKGTPEPQLNPPWAKDRDLSTSPGFQPEATPYPPLPFLFWAAKPLNWVKEAGRRLPLTSENLCTQWRGSPSVMTALQHPSRISSRTQQTGKKSPETSQCTDLYFRRY